MFTLYRLSVITVWKSYRIGFCREFYRFRLTNSQKIIKSFVFLNIGLYIVIISSGKCTFLEQIKNISKFIKTKIFLLIKIVCILEFCIFEGLMHETKNLIVLRSLKNLPTSLIVFYYMLYNNFFYTQLASVFDLQKEFYIDHNNIDGFSFFFFRKMLVSFSGPFLSFVFFFFRKILISFACFFPESFWAFFDNI